jgi:hypothetical protein
MLPLLLLPYWPALHCHPLHSALQSRKLQNTRGDSSPGEGHGSREAVPRQCSLLDCTDSSHHVHGHARSARTCCWHLHSRSCASTCGLHHAGRGWQARRGWLAAQAWIPQLATRCHAVVTSAPGRGRFVQGWRGGGVGPGIPPGQEALEGARQKNARNGMNVPQTLLGFECTCADTSARGAHALVQ